MGLRFADEVTILLESGRFGEGKHVIPWTHSGGGQGIGIVLVVRGLGGGGMRLVPRRGRFGPATCGLRWGVGLGLGEENFVVGGCGEGAVRTGIRLSVGVGVE